MDAEVERRKRAFVSSPAPEAAQALLGHLLRAGELEGQGIRALVLCGCTRAASFVPNDLPIVRASTTEQLIQDLEGLYPIEPVPLLEHAEAPRHSPMSLGVALACAISESLVPQWKQQFPNGLDLLKTSIAKARHWLEARSQAAAKDLIQACALHEGGWDYEGAPRLDELVTEGLICPSWLSVRRLSGLLVEAQSAIEREVFCWILGSPLGSLFFRLCHDQSSGGWSVPE